MPRKVMKSVAMVEVPGTLFSPGSIGRALPSSPVACEPADVWRREATLNQVLLLFRTRAHEAANFPLRRPINEGLGHTPFGGVIVEGQRLASTNGMNLDSDDPGQVSRPAARTD